MIRRLYNWALQFAGHPYAMYILAFAAFIEASVFIIPPYPLQIAISIQNTRRSLWIAAVATASSVMGGFVGYAIGFWFWNATQGFFYKYFFSPATYEAVTKIYQENAVMALILASITPLPFKAMTIIGGAAHVPLLTFFIGALIGRSIRFFFLGILFYIWGPPMKEWLEKHLERIVLALTALVVIALAAYYFWSHR